MEDILLIDKPRGITSFDVIRRLRRKLGVQKMGHAGTLDPLASGLLIIGIGEGTKKLGEYLKLPKTYDAEVFVGERRSTGDMEGEVLEKKEVEELDTEQVKTTLKDMVGILELPVPAYSAVKVGGKRLYSEARKSVRVEPPMRAMELQDAVLNSIEKDSDGYVLDVRFSVASGVYIRSLAEELGRRLGYPATLKNLRRTQIGEFKVENAEKLEV